MKPISRLCTCLFLLVLLAPASEAFAKGRLGKITIAGPGLVAPIEVTDWKILEVFDSNLSGFVDFAAGSIPEPRVGPPYQITLFVTSHSNETVFWKFYALNYYANPSGGRGYVHDFHMGGTGKWFHVTPGGDAVMERLLRDRGAFLTSSLSVVAGDLIARRHWIIALMITPIVGAGTVWLLRRRRQMPA